MHKMPKIEGRVWIGSKPITQEELTGKVVLADFWTYSCVNCRRTIPYLRDWYEKYKDQGFTIIGIHAPEFEFEKLPENVTAAMKDLGVTWPVVLDNEHENWDHFANRYWPAKYLADKTGEIVYTHFGEGSYEETETKIRELLGLEKLTGEKEDPRTFGVCFVSTPETYCGYLRGNIGNELGYAEDMEDTYTKSENAAEGKINLSGKFFATDEYVESREEGASLSLRFHASEVNLVMSPAKKEAIVEIFFSGKPLPEKFWTSDVRSDGTILVNRSDMFRLFHSKEEAEGVIEIRAKTGDFRAFAFTFSGCSET